MTLYRYGWPVPSMLSTYSFDRYGVDSLGKCPTPMFSGNHYAKLKPSLTFIWPGAALNTLVFAVPALALIYFEIGFWSLWGWWRNRSLRLAGLCVRCRYPLVGLGVPTLPGDVALAAAGVEVVGASTSIALVCPECGHPVGEPCISRGVRLFAPVGRAASRLWSAIVFALRWHPGPEPTWRQESLVWLRLATIGLLLLGLAYAVFVAGVWVIGVVTFGW